MMDAVAVGSARFFFAGNRERVMFPIAFTRIRKVCVIVYLQTLFTEIVNTTPFI